MKGLKFAAIASFALLIVVLALVGYLFWIAEVEIVDVQIRSTPVSAEELEQLKLAVEQDTFYGTLFQKPRQWLQASEYVWLTYQLRIRNHCLVPLDMLEVQVVPSADDVLQTAALQVKSLDLKSEGVIDATILTTRNTHSIRELITTYYLWGVSGNTKTVYGQ